jgi:predicted ribosome quality control (RQC) complex YloA/Tae2 family protein
VSNAIRYDSLLVRELARELHNVLAGARLEGLFLDRERLRLTLRTKPASRGATG